MTTNQTASEPSALSMPDAQPVDDGSAPAQLPFPTVAIGTSAGGVEALTRFFRAMPADSGCAFVVVMHLSPDHKSMLAPLLARVTTMPVAQAQHDTPLQPDHVYIAPPGQYLELAGGRLQLRAMGGRAPKPVSVDHFMVSLAADQRERAIGIVLTGVASDGSLGIKAIKAEGGLTMAQSPDSAAHRGMPDNAIATGVIDRELAIDDMPAAIVEYVADAGLRAAGGAAGPGDPQLLAEILDAVRTLAALDFRGYKPPMLRRRVRRRMGITRIGTLQDYLNYLRSAPSEARALADDFLISVTEFFREIDAWELLARQVLPQLLERKQVGDAVRVWVPACATGEEAYSIAMLLLEQPRVQERRLKLQVFATDIDREALDFARRGRYPESIEHAVSAERLRRFFVHSGKHYQVRKELREAVMFAPQNVVSDPPFSHMDMVSCRNLLIYMEAERQRRVLEMLHFALDADGVLVLGKSETIGSHTHLFRPALPGARIFCRVGAARVPAAPRMPGPPGWRAETPGGRAAPPSEREPDYGHVLRDALLEHRIGAALLTNKEGRALYFYGPVQAYLLLPQGEPTADLFAMLPDGLRPHLRAALHKAITEHTRVETLGTVGAPGDERPVRVVTAPLPAAGEELVLVTFETLERTRKPARAVPDTEAAALRSLEEELSNTKRELRATIEELESTNEELKVANEEAMSMNEELQSANEELETSKEELQSVNEELSTVNNQLLEKVDELESVNDDLSNLLSSTRIPTLFLDRGFHIKRFTPAVKQLFSLIPGDVNRPLTDIASRVDVASLLDDARQVLDKLAPVEHEVSTAQGQCYLRRTLPYRTIGDRIDGVVITFTDITQLKHATEGLRRFAAVMHSSNDAIVVHDLAGRVLAWNRAAEAMYGRAESEVLNTDIARLLPEEVRAAYAAQVERVKAGERSQGIESRRRRRDGSLVEVSVTVSLVHADDGTPAAIALTERDITPRKRADDALRESERRFRMLADSAPVLVWMSNAAGAIEFVNQEFARFTGLQPAQLVGRPWIELLHPDDQEHVATEMRGEDGQGQGEGRVSTTAQLQCTGGYRWMKVTAMPRHDGERRLPGSIGSMVDIDAQVGAERALRVANRRKDEFLAMLGHELRNPLVPIRNAAEVLKHVASGDSRIAWVRDTLVRQVDHVTRLVDDLLDISLITRGTMRLHLEPVNLAHIVRRACEGAEPAMRRKRHRFECTLPDDAAMWVEGDAIRVGQVFENLLTNAAKYTDEEGAIALELRRDGEHALVRVRDNGLGIAPAMQSRIFDLFVQDERAIDRSQGGLGIGLALVRRLVELHHGQVDARSEGIGRGCEFSVRLPLLPVQRAQGSDAENVATGSGSGRVMVVDDDVDGAESLAMVLRMVGYEVELAHDLETALQVARRFRPQAVLMDMAMPRADGCEVAKRLRALPHDGAAPHFIALSGFGQPEDFRRSEQAGFARHLVKPVDPADLQRRLQRLLDGAA